MKFDTIRRILLNYFNINVVMMMGVTDIDDKIIIRAAERKEEPRRLAERYEMEFFEDMASLNIMPPTVVTKVTNFIPQIINFVQKIIDKGQAYSTENGKFYFSLFISNLIPRQVGECQWSVYSLPLCFDVRTSESKNFHSTFTVDVRKVL